MSCVFLFIFFPCRSFSPWWALAFLIFPPPLQNFHVFLPTKKCLLCLLSLALFVAPFLVELCWPVAYFLFFSVSSSLYSKFVDMTINLSLILSRTRIQKKFRLYWLFSCLCFTRREWLCDFRQKNLKLPYLCVDWVIFTLVYLWWGRMVGRAGVRSRDYQNFLDAQVTKFSYPRCSAAKERALLISRR